MVATAADRQLNEALARFAEYREQARRFHPETLGRGVDARRCLADFLVRVARRDDAGIEKVYGSCRSKAALSASGGASGGYLVPAELALSLMQSVAEAALVRKRAHVQPMASATMTLPLPDASAAQAAGTSPFFGGILMNWSPEAQTESESAEPAFRDVELRANDLSGYALASNNMLADAAGLEAYLRRLIAAAVAWYEDYAFLRGDGVGKPLGMMNAPAAVAVTRQTASLFTLQDLGGMSRALLPSSWERAVWVVHPLVWAQLVALNTNAWQVNQPIAEGAGRPHFVLNGQAGFVSEKLPPLGTRGDVLLIDPALYVVGDRQALEIDASPHPKFTTAQTAWRVLERVDGQPWFGAKMTAADGSTSLSPYVVLS